MYTVIVDGEEVVLDAPSARAAARAARRGTSSEVSSLPTVVKVTVADKLRMAFDMESLQEKLETHISEMTLANSKEMDQELVAIIEQANQRLQAQNDQPSIDGDGGGAAGENDPTTLEESSAASVTDQADAADDSTPLPPSRSGRVRRKPSAAGASLANYWGGPTQPQRKKTTLGWNTEEYRLRMRQLFSSPDPLKLYHPTLIDPLYTSNDLDPIEPDRISNEIFQIPPSWRLEWRNPLQRFELKLSTLPLNENGIFKSFELPYEQYGEEMTRIQKKDLPPKFQLVTKSQSNRERQRQR